MIEQINEKIDDKDIFPELYNSHISRGVDLLYDEYQLKGSYDKVLDSMFKLM